MLRVPLNPPGVVDGGNYLELFLKIISVLLEMSFPFQDFTFSWRMPSATSAVLVPTVCTQCQFLTRERNFYETHADLFSSLVSEHEETIDTQRDVIDAYEIMVRDFDQIYEDLKVMQTGGRGIKVDDLMTLLKKTYLFFKKHQPEDPYFVPEEKCWY
jgi:hypothetical protein